MKKMLSLLLLPVLVLTLAACGGSADGGFSGGSGTEADPYLISSADDLWAMASLINSNETRPEYTAAHYRMVSDIDLGGKKQWTPIDGCDLGFEGVFDGSGHTLKGLYINYKDPLSGNGEHEIGLFGQVKGTVKNLTVSDSSVTVKSDRSPYTAVIAAVIRGGSVENCHTTASVSVTSSFDAAGIAGSVNDDAAVSGCTNAASVTVTATGNAGGICFRAAGPVSNCVNTGAIRAEAKAAGISVAIYGGATDCRNEGDILAEHHAGGICASFEDGALNHGMNDASVTLLRCVNTGNVTSASSCAAGIATGCRTGKVVACENSGSVEGSKESGGILAFFQPSSFGEASKVFQVTDCVNTGSVTVSGDDMLYPTGGICGKIYQAGTSVFFENCRNEGAVTAMSPTGGILGAAQCSQLTFTGCENTGRIQGMHACGGIAGQYQSSRAEGVTEDIFTAENCRNEGSVFTDKPYGFREYGFAGGILGSWRQEEGFVLTVSINNCVNLGSLDGNREDIILCIHDLCGTYAQVVAE